MPQPKSEKQKEGFVIVDDQGIPEELRKEIKHYNGLVQTLVNTNSVCSHTQALVVSENRIKKLLQKNQGLYPQKIAFGPIILMQHLQRKPIDVSGFMQELNATRADYGEEYLNRLLLFDSAQTLSPNSYDLGWSTGSQNGIDLEATQNNLFMMAVRAGNKQLVAEILNSVVDNELKKRMLLQVMEYRSNGELLFKPILEFAIESNSSELVTYLFQTMEALGILDQAAKEFGNFVQARSEQSNILLKAMEQNNPELTAVVLRNRDKLGQILFVSNSDKVKYPDYVVSDFTLMPAFVYPILDTNRTHFIGVFNQTRNQFQLDFEKDSYSSLSNKFSQLIGFSSVIKLNAYVANEDYDPVIFRRLLEHKINMHKQVTTMNALKFQYARSQQMPMPMSKEDTLDTLRTRMRLWEGVGSVMMEPSVAREFLEIPNVLNRLYVQARKANNHSAAAIVLLELFRENQLDQISTLINKADRTSQTIFLNYFLLEGLKTNNPSLIDFATNFKFEVRRDVLVTLTTLPKAQMLHVAKEFFHNLHQKNVRYQLDDLQIVMKAISSHAKDFAELREPLELFLEEMEKNLPSTRPGITFFSQGPNPKEIRQLIHEIRTNPSLHLESGKGA